MSAVGIPDCTLGCDPQPKNMATVHDLPAIRPSPIAVDGLMAALDDGRTVK